MSTRVRIHADRRSSVMGWRASPACSVRRGQRRGAGDVVGGSAAAAAGAATRRARTGSRVLSGCAEAALAWRLEVIAPSKTPRAPGTRSRATARTRSCFARAFCSAGQLKGGPAVPPAALRGGASVPAPAREQVRGDLMRARHRVSKASAAAARSRLRRGRVDEDTSAGRWLEQRFEQSAAELAYLDPLAAVDAWITRAAALDEAAPRLAVEGGGARSVPGRGIDTLSLRFVLALDSATSAPFPASSLPSCRPGLASAPSARPVRGEPPPGRDHQDRLRLRPPAPGRGRLALPRPARSRCRARRTPRRAARPRDPDRPPRPATPSPPRPTPPRTRQTRQRQNRRRRPRTRLLPLGRRRGRLTPAHSRLFGRAPGQTLPGTRDTSMGNPDRPRPFLESARPATQPGQWGSQPPHHQTDASDVVAEPDAHPNSHSTGQTPVDAAWTTNQNRPPYQSATAAAQRKQASSRATATALTLPGLRRSRRRWWRRCSRRWARSAIWMTWSG